MIDDDELHTPLGLLLVYDPAIPTAAKILERLDAENRSRFRIPDERQLRDAMRECRRAHFSQLKARRNRTEERKWRG